MEPWHYDTWPDLEHSFLDRLRRFPREPDRLVFGLRWLTACVLRPWLRLFHRLTIVGRENLPAHSSFVMVANHASHLDTLCLLAALPMARLDHAFPAAASDYFFGGGIRAFLATVVANALPFDRHGDPWRSLDVCKQLLAEPGNIVIVFPEGSRSRTGELGDFKPGVGMLLAESDVPVVPCCLNGAFAALPTGAWLPRPRAVQLTIGTPLVYAHRRATTASAKQICRELRDRVRLLGAVGPEVKLGRPVSQRVVKEQAETVRILLEAPLIQEVR
jgi:1-acyl-sn-glycerol-3-phosphate acyltransferase